MTREVRRQTAQRFNLYRPYRSQVLSGAVIVLEAIALVNSQMMSTLKPFTMATLKQGDRTVTKG
ncbi:MAG: hypothetical protein ACFE0J_25790 [Elainellaceae cyanobacterium]